MKQILIIDDEKDILKSVNAILTEEGYKCYEALNSKDALNIYNSSKNRFNFIRCLVRRFQITMALKY